MTENQYQAKLIRKIEKLFPGCVVMKNDAGLRQGIPDLILLVGDQWAALEVKVSPTAAERPNQRWYIQQLSDMSFATFIYPENEEEVLNALQQAFASRGRTCIPES